MKVNYIRIASAAANAADMASVAATAAENLLMEDPTAWELADQAYWMCLTAQKTAEAAADALDAEAAEDNPEIVAAHVAAMRTAKEAADQAAYLEKMAKKAGHEIRR